MRVQLERQTSEYPAHICTAINLLTPEQLNAERDGMRRKEQEGKGREAPAGGGRPSPVSCGSRLCKACKTCMQSPVGRWKGAWLIPTALEVLNVNTEIGLGVQSGDLKKYHCEETAKRNCRSSVTCPRSLHRCQRFEYCQVHSSKCHPCMRGSKPCCRGRAGSCAAPWSL